LLSKNNFSLWYILQNWIRCRRDIGWFVRRFCWLASNWDPAFAWKSDKVAFWNF